MPGIGSPGDATIDIPLTNVLSKPQTGARKADTATAAPTMAHDHDLGPATEKALSNPFGGRRRGLGDIEDTREDSTEDGTITKMGQIYMKILNFSVVTRYFIYVLPLAALFAVPIIIGATVAHRATIGGVSLVWFFVWIEIVWLSLWVSKVVAHYIPFVFQFLCGIVSSGTRKYSLILRALEIPISLVGWAVTSLATFAPIMTRNPVARAKGDTGLKPWQTVVQNILFACVVSALILTVEKVLVQLISISYHRKQFETRIQESKSNVRVLTLLYEASRKMFPEYCPEFEAEDYIINDSLVAPVTRPGHKRTGSASPMRLIQGVGRVGGRVGDKITSVFGNIAQEITGKQVFNSGSAHSTVVVALEKQKSSEALARRLWMSFVLQGRNALYPDDLKEVFGAGHEQEAEDCFALLDNDENGDISLEEMILKVAEVGRVRQSISKSMHDVDQAINVLDNLLCTVVFVIVILVFVAFLNKGFGTTLAAGATALLSLSFVFAVTAQEVLGSCIFLFVKHPYDVGDRVEIGDRQLIVERISLLYTVFRSVTDQRTVQTPNIVLNTVWLDNITRSKAMRERLTLTVDFGTSFGDIQLLKNEMQKFVRDKENCRDFQPDVDVEVIDLGKMDKLDLRIEIRHKSNWSNESIRATRRSKFMCALVLAVRKIPVYGPGGGDAALGGKGNPTYSVAIPEEQATFNRETWAADKEAKRMVPTSEMDSVLQASPPQDPANTRSTTTGFEKTMEAELKYRGAQAAAAEKQSTETAFIGKLNSRSAAADQARIDKSDVLHPIDAPSAAVLRQPSTGQRKPSATPHMTGLSANTPADYHEYATPFFSSATTATTTTPAAAAPSTNPYTPRPPAPPAAGAGHSGPPQQRPQYPPQQPYPPPH